MTVNFRGYVFAEDGSAVGDATVLLLETGTTNTEASTTTNDDGLWLFEEPDQDRYDVKISVGTSTVRYIAWDSQVSFKELDVRNNTAATTPAATFTNITNSAANQVAVFSGANSTKADDDEIYLSFKMHDSAGNLDEFARMTVVATDVTTTSEDGQIEFDVIKGGTLTKVWTITSSTGAAMSFDMNVDALTIGSGADTDISLTFDANSADGVITWMEDEDYFKFSDDILMNSTERISFYDTAIYIYSSTDGQLDLVADTEIQIAATTIDINGAVAFNGALTGITNITLTGTLSDGNYTFDTSGNVSGLGTIGSGAITSTSTVQGTTITATTAFVPDASDGAALGTTSLEFSDLYLADGAVVGFGDDQEVTLTHVHDTGLLLSSTDRLQFGDSGTFIHQSADGVLTIESDTTVDINGAVALNGAITGATDITLTGVLDAATLDLSSSADIAGDLVLSGGADGALQFSNAGENSIKIPDNQASALIIEEANNAYITFVTTDSSEAITVAKATTFSAGIANAGTIAAGTWNGTAIASGYIAADAITGAKIADDAIDSEHYAAASIDFAHIQNVAANSVLGRNANSSGVLSEVALATTQLLIGDGTGFTAAALSGDATMTNAGVVSLATTQNSITTMTGLVTTSALNSGSITSGFGTIDTGSSAITTTGLISGGSLDIDNVLINGTTIGHTDDTDLMTVADGLLTVAGALTTGVNDAGHNVIFYGNTASRHMKWEASTDSLNLPDNTKLYIGTGADAELYFDGTNLICNAANISGGALKVETPLYINDTSNANMTMGLTINQGGTDDQILALKSSGVGHGLTTATRRKDVETDDFFVMGKLATTGGVIMQAMIQEDVDNVALAIEAYGATGNTTKGTSANACVEFYITNHNNADSLSDVDADANIFGVRARVGGADVMRFLIDEDGDLYSVTSAQTFDQYDDALMVRALDQVKGDVIRDKWDDYVTYNEQALIDAEVLGAPIAEGGLTNVTQLQRLHNGAIWQGYVRQRDMQERIDTLEGKLLALEGAR